MILNNISKKVLKVSLDFLELKVPKNFNNTYCFLEDLYKINKDRYETISSSILIVLDNITNDDNYECFIQVQISASIVCLIGKDKFNITFLDFYNTKAVSIEYIDKKLQIYDIHKYVDLSISEFIKTVPNIKYTKFFDKIFKLII